MNYNCSNLWDIRNLQEQVKKPFCYQKLFWPFTVWINCSRDLKIFANSWPTASNFKSFSRSLEHFFFSQEVRTICPFVLNDMLLRKIKQFWRICTSHSVEQFCLGRKTTIQIFTTSWRIFTIIQTIQKSETPLKICIDLHFYVVVFCCFFKKLVFL